jgi:hypothetical protein
MIQAASSAALPSIFAAAAAAAAVASCCCCSCCCLLQVDDPQTHQGRLAALVRSYLLPQGFPESVAPQYAGYMGWRGVQYFFGGAMSVFTTKCLLTSLGVAGRHSVSFYSLFVLVAGHWQVTNWRVWCLIPVEGC